MILFFRWLFCCVSWDNYLILSIQWHKNQLILNVRETAHNVYHKLHAYAAGLQLLILSSKSGFYFMSIHEVHWSTTLYFQDVVIWFLVGGRMNGFKIISWNYFSQCFLKDFVRQWWHLFLIQAISVASKAIQNGNCEFICFIQTRLFCVWFLPLAMILLISAFKKFLYII